jgi:glycerol-3-phosphate acyltransferase PlsY
MIEYFVLCEKKFIEGEEIMLGILFILNLILAVMACIFAIKNVLVNFKESKSRLKNSGVIFFIIIILVLSLIGSVSAMRMEEHTSQLKSNLSNVDNFIHIGEGGVEINQREEIQKQLDLVNSERVKVLIFTILGYLFFACLWALHKNIIKEISGTKVTGGWGQSKYKS